MNSCQESSLVGIARLASESMPLLEKRQASYFELEAKSILNRCSNPQMPFYWTINPYRGCEFACKYCYARYTHEYMGMEEGEDFERKIYSKKDAARVLGDGAVRSQTAKQARCDRHGHRSLPACRATLLHHPKSAGSFGYAAGSRALDHNEIGSCDSGYRCP